MFRFKVMPDGGEPYELEATSRDVMQWERRTKGASVTRLNAEMRMTDLYKIAYLAAARQNVIYGALSEQEFMDSADLEVLDDDEEDDETVPTLPAA